MKTLKSFEWPKVSAWQGPVIFYGECPTQLDAAIAHAKHLLRATSADTTLVITQAGATDWEALTAQGSQQSIFDTTGTAQVIGIRVRSSQNALIAKELSHWLSTQASDAPIWIAFDAPASSIKSLKSLKQAQITVPYYPLSGNALRHWLVDYAASHHRKLDDSAIRLLLTNSDKRLWIGKNAIDCALMQQTNPVLTGEMIACHLPDLSGIDVFNLTAAIASQNKSEVIRIIARLKALRVPLALVVGGLQYWIKQLAGTKKRFPSTPFIEYSPPQLNGFTRALLKLDEIAKAQSHQAGYEALGRWCLSRLIKR